MSPLAYDILGYAIGTFVIGVFVFILLVLVASEWPDKFGWLFIREKKRPKRKRAVVKRAAKRTTPARSVRRRHA